METSILIAKLYSVVLLALGLGLLIHHDYYKKLLSEMMKNKTFLFGNGVFATIVGLLIVSFHNVWEQSWVVVITIMGWAALLKGLLLLGCPELVKYWDPLLKKENFIKFGGVFLIVAGLFFGYYGFFV